MRGAALGTDETRHRLLFFDFVCFRSWDVPRVGWKSRGLNHANTNTIARPKNAQAQQGAEAR